MLIIFGSIYAYQTLDLSDPLNITNTMPPFGGAAANQAFIAARHDLKTVLVSAAGDDMQGKYIATYLRRSGVVTSGVALHPKKTTGSLIEVMRESGKTETLTAPGANKFIKHDQIPDEILSHETILLIPHAPLLATENKTLCQRAATLGAPIIMSYINDEDIEPDSLADISLIKHSHGIRINTDSEKKAHIEVDHDILFNARLFDVFCGVFATIYHDTKDVMLASECGLGAVKVVHKHGNLLKYYAGDIEDILYPQDADDDFAYQT